MKSKILTLLLITVFLSACSSGGGGGGETPVTPPNEDKSSCVFDNLNDSQITSYLNKVDQSWTDYKSVKGCPSEVDAHIVFAAVFANSLVGLQSDVIIEKSITNKSLEKAVLEIFDSQACQIKSLDKEQINTLKQCKWSEL